MTHDEARAQAQQLANTTDRTHYVFTDAAYKVFGVTDHYPTPGAHTWFVYPDHTTKNAERVGCVVFLAVIVLFAGALMLGGCVPGNAQN